MLRPVLNRNLSAITGEILMLALNIGDIKDFTNKLFLGEVFDRFFLTEATITTFNTFSIDGRLRTDYFDTAEQELLTQSGRGFSYWKELRSLCCSIVRGKHTPLGFRIVFQLPADQIAALVSVPDFPLCAEQIQGFYLNIQFRNRTLLCTTGTSLKTLFPGRQADLLWDDWVLQFFRQNQIPFRLCD